MGTEGQLSLLEGTLPGATLSLLLCRVQGSEVAFSLLSLEGGAARRGGGATTGGGGPLRASPGLRRGWGAAGSSARGLGTFLPFPTYAARGEDRLRTILWTPRSPGTSPLGEAVHSQAAGGSRGPGPRQGQTPVGPRSSPFSLRAEALGTQWLLRPGWPLGLVCQQRRPAGARGWCVSGWLVGPAAPRAWPWAVRGGGPVGWGTSRTTRFPGAGPQQVPGHPCWCHSRGGGRGGRSGEPRGLTGLGAKRAAALRVAPGAGGAGGAGGVSLGASSRCMSVVGAGAHRP